jgi:hypothetical protein
MITPPATINIPPTITENDGTCLKNNQEIACAVRKKNTTYNPRSFPKSHGGELTVKPYAPDYS